MPAGMSYPSTGKHTMNTQTIKGNWMQLKGEIRETWGKLTDDDMDVIAGQRDQLIGKIQERYGKTVDVIDREVQDFEARLSSRNDKPENL